MANQDYNVRQLLQMEACTNCQLCAEVCPAVNASGDGELSAVFRVKGLKNLLKGRTDFWRKLFKRKELSQNN
jgi:heterodisulfide reductase subunit D